MRNKFVIGTNGKATIDKPKGASLDYGADFTTSLTELGDTIASVTVESSSGLPVSNITHTDYIVKFMAGGGAVHTVEWVTATVTTNSVPPRTLVQTLYFNITPR